MANKPQTNVKNGTNGLSKEDKKLVRAIRVSFSETEQHDLRLSDENIIAIVDRCENWDDMADAERHSLFVKAEQAMEKIAVSDPSITALVDKIDEVFEAEIVSCVEGTMKSKTTAVDIYAQMKRVYSKEQLDETPIPGTDKDTAKGNKKPDKVTKVTSSGTEITKTFWNDFPDSTPEGREYNRTYDDVRKEQKTPGSVPALKDKSKKELASILSLATGKRNALRSMFKRAGHLHHQFEAIASMQHVKIEWIPGLSTGTVMPDKFGHAKGKPVTGSPKPIWIWPENEPSNGRDFSVTQILAFDVDKANAEGGTMAALIASTKGEPEPTELASMSPNEFEELIPDVVNFLNKKENFSTVLKRINSKDPAESDDLLDTLCTLYLITKTIYDKNKARFEKLQMKEDDEEKAA